MSNFLTRLLIILLVFLSLGPWSKYGRKSLVSCINWDDRVVIRNTRDINALMKVGSDMRIISNNERVSTMEKCTKCDQPFCSSFIIKKLCRPPKKVCPACARREGEKRQAERNQKQRIILNSF